MLVVNFLLLSLFGCELTEPLVSLSCPVTLYLESLGLEDDPNLKGVSNYCVPEKFNAQIFRGGIAMSQSQVRKLKEHLVFYDQSRELKRLFIKNNLSRAVEVKTRGLSVKRAYQKIFNEITPFLKNCSVIKLSSLSFKKVKKTYLFYLGRISTDKKPTSLMVQDGFVLDLQKLGVKTYPSPLAYVTWSSKMIKSLSEVIHVGIIQSEKENKIEKVTSDHFNIYQTYALIPGVGMSKTLFQVYELIQKVENNEI